MYGGDMGGGENVGEIELKPCPFCGCNPEINMGLRGGEIKCPHCGIGTGHIEDEYDYMEFTRLTEFGEEGYIRHKRPKGIEVAIEIWNRRAE